MRLITQAIYDETKFLLRKYPQLKQEEIGKLVNAPWGGISYRTVWLIKESNSLEEYRQMQKSTIWKKSREKSKKMLFLHRMKSHPLLKRLIKLPRGLISEESQSYCGV